MSAKPTSQRCPICESPADQHYRPFCSKRCADVDLNRWFSGSYAIPGEPVTDEDLPANDSGEDEDA